MKSLSRPIFPKSLPFPFLQSQQSQFQSLLPWRGSIRPSSAAPISARSSSLYSRPSLRELQSDKAANRALVYDFLRSAGIVPDELDGLELPVTVPVIRERLDFLRSLGLSVNDVNRYPLVLGCSVKKNMLPVLDYLGNIGVRQSAIADLLRRYPQVLHASVVVDLAPVVKYLRGMDVPAQAIPRVLERYPELLGFKLEGTMSTSVAYLVGIGVSRREIGGILSKFPEILGMRVARTIKPLIERLESLGLSKRSVAKLIEEKPQILGFSLEDQVNPNLQAIEEFGIGVSAIAKHPELLGLDLREKLLSQKNLLQSVIFLDDGEFRDLIEKMPIAVGLARSTVVKHVDFYRKSGFSIDQVRKMVVDCPQILALNLKIMETSLEYFLREMDGDLEELVAFPAFFTYGLDSTIKPRHLMVTKKELKCSLAWLLTCSDSKFQERMSFDSISVDDFDEEDEEEDDDDSESSDDYDDDDDDDDDDYV
ncbi:mitochondrial transcription termination factor family protein [Wolffia australiana]